MLKIVFSVVGCTRTPAHMLASDFQPILTWIGPALVRYSGCSSGSEMDQGHFILAVTISVCFRIVAIDYECQSES